MKTVSRRFAGFSSFLVQMCAATLAGWLSKRTYLSFLIGFSDRNPLEEGAVCINLLDEKLGRLVISIEHIDRREFLSIVTKTCFNIAFHKNKIDEVDHEPVYSKQFNA